jgi:viroplasmin and RNaseH domain-containing protein
VVFSGRVRGIYNSWRICQDQVSGYSNKSYRGYETLEEPQQEYQCLLDDEAITVEAIDQPVLVTQLPPEAVHALQ